MTHHAAASPAPAGADPGRQIVQLREALGLVERIAGRTAPREGKDAMLDQAARLSDGYDRALPIVQRRFDALALETAGWAAAGVEALLVAGERSPPRAAAARLAGQLERAINDLSDLVRQ